MCCIIRSTSVTKRTFLFKAKPSLLTIYRNELSYEKTTYMLNVLSGSKSLGVHAVCVISRNKKTTMKAYIFERRHHPQRIRVDTLIVNSCEHVCVCEYLCFVFFKQTQKFKRCDDNYVYDTTHKKDGGTEMESLYIANRAIKN